MKIYYESNSLQGHRSGVGRFSISLLKALINVQPEIEFLLFHFPGMADKDLENIEALGNTETKIIKLIPRKIFNLFMRLGIPVPLELMGIGGGDVYIFPDFISWPSLMHRKKYTVVHDLAFKYYPEYIQPRNLKYLNKQLGKSLNRSERILTVSQSTKKDLLKYYNVPEEKIDVIVCGIDHNIFRPRDRSSVVKVLTKYNLPDKYILFVGNIEPRKNISLMIEAYAKSFKDHGIALVLVGQKGWNDGEINDSFKRHVELPIYILDYVENDDLAPLYTAASLFLYLSLYEGFGLPVIEAMACGCPVLASNVSSIPEIAGNSAMLIDPYDTDRVAGDLTKLLTDKKLLKELSHKGIERAKRFNWDITAKDLSKIIIG